MNTAKLNDWPADRNGNPYPADSCRWAEFNTYLEKDMKVSDLKQSRFLTQHECDPPILVTIKGVRQENVAPEGAPRSDRWVMGFNECKPMVLNATNGELIQIALGSDDSADWIGKQIVLFRDPNVSYAGKITGGIRVRAVRRKAAPVVDTTPPWDDDLPADIEALDSDVPF